jgi:DNA-binding SARP family transcriptional activator
VIEFRVLGPLEVVRQGRVVEIGAGKKRALLAVLLLHAKEVVSTDRLIEEVWGERAPATAAKILQGYVSQLRKVLSDKAGGSILVTRPSGYALQLDAGQLDAERFTALLAQGRAAMAAGAPHDASMLLRDALALWRGPPLADFAFDSFAQDEIARLEELRLAAVEERVDADLALGREEDLVAELEALVARQPLRERLRGQLMTALYRCGRQAEALEVYQDARRALVHELGLEPGRRLQKLEQAILQQDPSLDFVPPPVAPRAADEQPAEQRSGDVFVGRQRELGVLLAALDDALSGRGRLVLIGGEPGIGKSRLAEELARRARDSGAEVVWGRCWEAGGAPPYWPWVQAIRACIRERTPQQLRAELTSGAVEVADLVPDVRQQLPDLGEPAAVADPQQARFRLFDAIADFLKNASRTRPLVIVLDDLNWADSESLLLLEFAARELPDAAVLLIGTYRDIELSRRHPLSKTLGELARERPFERVLLRGLAQEDVGRFIEATWGFVPDEALVRAVHVHTEGNPFFVTEVVRLLAEERTLTPDALGTPERWSTRIPEGVREAIGRRLDRLSGRCNETLTVAAAIGREFSFDQLARLTDELAEDRLLEGLEEALDAHVIEEPAGAAGRYQFTHALIQGTLVDELSLTRRARLHARVAQALEELFGVRAEAHAAELAHHFAEAETVLGSDKLVRYSLLAGESALAAHAPEQAIAYFQRALDAKAAGPADDETAALLFGLGRAQLATLPPHELEPAVANMRGAFDYYARAGQTERAVAIAAHPLPLSLRFGYTDAAGLIASALELVSDDSHDAGRLVSQHGWFAGFIEGDYDRAQDAFRRALAIAVREHDEALERRTLANSAFVDAFHLRWSDGIERGLRAIELTANAGDPRTEMHARRSVAFALVATGKCKQARLHTEAAVAQAEQLRESWWLTSTSFSNQLPCLYQGDWGVARAMSELGLAAEPRDPRHLALRAALEYELGNPDEGAAYVARLQEVAESVPPPGPIADHVFLAVVIPLVGRVSGSIERVEVAEAAVERVLALKPLNPALALYTKSGAALIAVQQSDADTARKLYKALKAQRGTASFFVPLSIDRLLGLLALTSGRLESALMHFEDGLAFCDRAGYRAEFAWIAADYADALRMRGDPDDNRKATELHEASLAISHDIGMRPLTERIEPLRTIGSSQTHIDEALDRLPPK